MLKQKEILKPMLTDGEGGETQQHEGGVGWGRGTGRTYETVRTGRSSHGWLGDLFWSSQFARVAQALFWLNLDTQKVFFRFED